MPSDNLSYLFAAFTVTWLVFFVYVFFVTRRQHELERVVQELRQALELGENPGKPSGVSGDG